MPLLSDQDFNKFVKRLEKLEKTVSGIQNSPIIIASPSKRFVLNDHLDVIKLNQVIEALANSIKLLVDKENGISYIAEDLRWHKIGNECVLEVYQLTEKGIKEWVSTGNAFGY